MKYIDDINDYWSGHSNNFDKVIRDEFESDKYYIWKHEVEDNLPTGDGLAILDVGCGPGFLTVLLAQLGHMVTGIDYNEKMLSMARRNAGNYGVSNKITLIRMDAQKLGFDDSMFDAVVCRNLTWTLEEPERAYSEWLRVLKSGGRLINFDANWDTRFHNNLEEKEYAKLLEGLNLLHIGSEYRTPEVTDKRYIEIRKDLPLSKKKRPYWDFKILYKIGCQSITVKPKIEGRLYDDFYEKLYANTPTFLVCATK